MVNKKEMTIMDLYEMLKSRDAHIEGKMDGSIKVVEND